MSEKKSFIIYKEWAVLISNLSDEDAGQLIKAICAHVNGERVDINNLVISAIYRMIEGQLDKDAEKYADIVKKRTQAINKRWNKNTNVFKDNTKEYKSIQNDSVNDNDNVNVNDNNKKSIRAHKKKYGEYKNVSLSDKDLESLNAEYGIDETQKAIKRLDEYIETSGKKYKNHALVMKRWVYKAVKEDAAKDNNPKIHNFESEREYNWDDIEKDLLRR